MKTRKGFKRTSIVILLTSFIVASRVPFCNAEETIENELILRTTIFKKENGEKTAVKSAVHALAFGNVERLYDKDLGLLVSFFWDEKEKLVITVDTRTYTYSISFLSPIMKITSIDKKTGKVIKESYPSQKLTETEKANKKSYGNLSTLYAKELVDLTKEKEQNIVIEDVVVREFLMPGITYEIQVKVIQTQKQAFYKKPPIIWWDAY